MATYTTSEFRAMIEYQLTEARAVINAKTAEAQAAAEGRHFYAAPHYEIGYAAALDWMLGQLAEDDGEREVEERPEDADLAARLAEGEHEVGR